MSNTLLPCPFCGGDAETKMYLWGHRSETQAPIWCYYTYCMSCDAMTDNVFESREETAAAWNRRAQPENEPLTLENGFDITNADGSPIDYDALGQKYKDHLCYCDIDGFYIGEDGQIVLMDDCGSAVWVDRGDYHIEVRKPERSEGE